MPVIAAVWAQQFIDEVGSSSRAACVDAWCLLNVYHMQRLHG